MLDYSVEELREVALDSLLEYFGVNIGEKNSSSYLILIKKEFH
ncbi:MAG: hypothetical protein SPL00_04400 [Bacilli bacterium]|nr:hypothetical protein [Bacilli bacterium]